MKKLILCLKYYFHIKRIPIYFHIIFIKLYYYIIYFKIKLFLFNDGTQLRLHSHSLKFPILPFDFPIDPSSQMSLHLSISAPSLSPNLFLSIFRFFVSISSPALLSSSLHIFSIAPPSPLLYAHPLPIDLSTLLLSQFPLPFFISNYQPSLSISTTSLSNPVPYIYPFDLQSLSTDSFSLTLESRSLPFHLHSLLFTILPACLSIYFSLTFLR